MSDTLYSSHIFMFPFRFDIGYSKKYSNSFDFYSKKTIDERINLKKLNRELTDNGWIYEKFKIEGKDKHLLYSEYAYFYDYARDGIYNLSDFSENSISNFYRKKEFDKKKFEISIKQKGSGDYVINSSLYVLTIEGITLRVFNTGVAILSIELENKDYPDFSDILRINDYGRRVYPQFIGKDGIQNTKETFLADIIKIHDMNMNTNFSYKKTKDAGKIGLYIMKILGEKIFTQEEKENLYYIKPSLDDRMFVLSWYGNDKLSREICQYDTSTNSDDWYKYIFIDNGDVTVKNEKMKKNLIKEATYDRWSGYNTIFGITRYSFMLLSESKKSLIKNNADFVILHTTTIYFQMMILLLANRASILRFSDEIAAVATSKDVDRLQPLYERYLTFYNRLYFKEVTHQDQGIELYDIARKQMRIDEHIEKLDNKFSKLFEYADLKANNETNDYMNKLTIMGAVFLPPSIMIALFSMGIFDYTQSIDALSVGLGSIVLSGIGSYFAFKFLGWKKVKKYAWLFSILFLSVFILLSVYSLENIGEKNSKKTEIFKNLKSYFIKKEHHE